MSCASPSKVLVSHKFAEDRHLPSLGEIIVVRLSQDLFGPGSIIGSRGLPSCVTRPNYHHAVILSIKLEFEAGLTFTVLPIPTYSAADPISGLFSTSWLLSQAVDFQQKHIPVPYEPSLTQLQPPFPTPAGFGDPLEVGGWRNSRPSWVLAVPQVTYLHFTTIFECFEPPVILNNDELRHLRAYCGLFPSPVAPSGSTMSPFPSGSEGSAFGSPDTLPSRNGGGSSYHHQPDERDNHAGAGPPSLAFQALYANDAVKQAFASFDQPSIVLDSDSDSNDEDDDWEDRMDPVTFLRYYAHSDPRLAKIVQEHDQKMRTRLHQEIMNWVEGIQPETSEGDAFV